MSQNHWLGLVQFLLLQFTHFMLTAEVADIVNAAMRKPVHMSIHSPLVSLLYIPLLSDLISRVKHISQ